MGTYEDITALLEYVWEAEEKHYETEPTDNHIFVVIKKINEWINSPACPLVPELEDKNDSEKNI